MRKISILIFLILLCATLLCGCKKENTVDNSNETVEVSIKSGFGKGGDPMPSTQMAVKSDTNVFDTNEVEVDLFFGSTNSSDLQGYFERRYGYVEGDAVTLKLYITNYITILPNHKFLINENFVPYKEFTDYFDSETGKINDKYDDNYYSIYRDQTPIGDKVAVSPDLFCDDYGKIYFTITEYFYKGEDFLAYGKNNCVALYYIKKENKVTLYSERPETNPTLPYNSTINLLQAIGYNVKAYNSNELSNFKNNIYESYSTLKENVLYDIYPEINQNEFKLKNALYITDAEQTKVAYVLWFSDIKSATVGKVGFKNLHPSLAYQDWGKNDSYFGIMGDLIGLIWNNGIIY